MFGAFGKVENLFLIRNFPSPNSNAIKQSFNFRIAEWVSFKDRSIPNKNRQHLVETKANSLN